MNSFILHYLRCLIFYYKQKSGKWKYIIILHKLSSYFGDFRQVKKISSYCTDFEQVTKISSYFSDFEQVAKSSSYFADFEQVKKPSSKLPLGETGYLGHFLLCLLVA